MTTTPPDTDDVVTVRGLICRYGDHTAVDGIDLQVRRGEVFALLGTNGAGKTTTLDTLAGRRRADDGSVRVLGLDPGTQARELRSRTGEVLQESGFAGDLTVAETCRLWSSLRRTAHGADWNDQLEVLQLAHRRDVPVRQLSGGERRRLDLALATLGEPELLVLDEPTTGLDPTSRQHTWDVLRNLVASGTTVLLTTHYLNEAEALADRLAILHRGRIQLSGTVAQVLAAVPSQISFVLPAGVSAGELPRTSRPLPVTAGAGPRPGVDTVELGSVDVQADLWALLSWAEGRQLPLARLQARSASLDDVFRSVDA
ncbi:ABC transporter ATP-binding protein [Motilibacter aurantiacus]|uniref:ABC transporter ATP-binding protein n=1 Tax=Motilibacter aurantiacus TaxID=2714955 RepID=UPI00140E3EAE|nr:ABC transporter ATP-binding protein [Motilibacter aurantiacus]NHC43803.1 ABC transporter ATP-binding protein [Motilibacter aurantiacus]